MVIDPSYRGFLEGLADQRFSPEADARCQWLMERNNDGLLSDAEREELKGLADLSQYMSLVCAQARIMLGRNLVGTGALL
jgi:hypothetical protein